MKLHWRPREFAFLPPKERALMYAFIETKAEDEEKQRRKISSRMRKK